MPRDTNATAASARPRKGALSWTGCLAGIPSDSKGLGHLPWPVLGMMLAFMFSRSLHGTIARRGRQVGEHSQPRLQPGSRGVEICLPN
mmetsp:Transcript_62097/g.192375  ORF Transcript_62097/g.192375 Transcript_62097/m.192375 type:complete len:88 (+) Transcript_62097:494-757(+)